MKSLWKALALPALAVSLTTLAACGQNAATTTPNVRAASTALTIDAFTTTSSAQYLPTTLAWEVTGAPSGNLTCQLNFGDNSSTVTLPNCTPNDTLDHVYTTSGNRTATLTVTDPGGNSATTTTTFAVTTTSDERFTFDDPRFQNAWQLVLSSPQQALLNLRYNTSEGLAAIPTPGTIVMMVPEPISSRSEFQHVLNAVGVTQGRISTWYRIASNFDQDRVVVSNVLLGSRAEINAASTLTPAQFEAAVDAALREPIILTASVRARSLSAAYSSKENAVQALSAGCTEDCTRSLARYRYAHGVAQFGLGLLSSDVYSITRDYFISVGADLIELYGGVYSSYAKSITGYQAAISVIGVSAGYIGVQYYQAALACLNKNGYDSGNAVIAILSPPLPFSQQVFVQSVPDRYNLASGYINRESATSILTRGVPNAIATFESLTDKLVLQDSEQVDGGTQTISVAYSSHSTPPVCPQ